MEINWFTVGAQLLNFLLLVWLLKRFLYGPILAAIATREQLIKTQLTEAAAQKADATTEHEEFRQKNADFDARRQELLATATAEAHTERQHLLKQARHAADALRAKQAQAQQQLQERLPHDLARQTRQAVLALTRKALTDLASADLETQAVAVFIGRVKQLAGNEKREFITAFQAAGAPLQVRSAFELSTGQRADLSAALAPLTGAGAAYEFAIAPELLSGISLSAHGHKLAWSVPDYLTELESSLRVARPAVAEVGVAEEDALEAETPENTQSLPEPDSHAQR